MSPPQSQPQHPPSQPRASSDTSSESHEIEYYSIRYNQDTFQNRKLRTWVKSHLPAGPVLDACAGKTVLDHPDLHRNDIDAPSADTQLDVADLSALPQSHFDSVIYDAPYSPRQADKKYDSPYPGYHSAIKAELARVLAPGGRVIQLGYTGVGMPAQTFDRTATAIFNVFGRGTDIFGVVDEHAPADGTTAPRADTVSSSWECYTPRHETGVVLNAGEGTATDNGATEAVDISLSYTDESVADPPLTDERVQRHIKPHLKGNVLVAITEADIDLDWELLVTNDGRLDDNVTLTQFGVGSAPDTTIAIGNLAETFGAVWDTIVYAPPPSYFSLNYHDDNGTPVTGVDSDARQQFDDLLRPGGSVIQVGHTTTNMPGDLAYTRQRVTALVPITEFDQEPTRHGPRATPTVTYITIDEKPGTPNGRMPVPRVSQACLYCGEEFRLDLRSLHVGCDTCGARYDERCRRETATDDVRTLRGYTMHRSRVKEILATQAERNPCSASPSGTHEFAAPAFNIDSNE